MNSEQTGPSLTEQLARFLTERRSEDLPDRVLHRAKYYFLDWLGSAIAGGETEAGRILLDFARQRDGKESTVIGLEVPRSVEVAAFVNGALSHIVEMDDLHRASVIHPAAPVIPAALASAEQLCATGRDMLAAIVFGYEVAIRIGEAVGKSHYKIWHNTATCGTFGAAAAAGWLMGLSHQQMVWALGNAGSQSAGLWQFIIDGAMTKHLHAGKAAMNGWIAAALAKQGFTGPREILEGRQGFFAATSQDAEPAKVVDGLSSDQGQYKIEGVSIKPHASCRHTHSTIDAALRLRENHRFEPDQISRVRIQTYRAALDLTDNIVPQNPYAAKFSIQYCAARALLTGRVGLADFYPERISESDARVLMNKTTVEIDEELDRHYPAEWAARITVTLVDGTMVSEMVSAPKGDPENPLTDFELEQKFLQMIAGSQYENHKDALLAFSRGLHQQHQIRPPFLLGQGLSKY